MNLLEKYNIQKVEIMCEKHGKQVVSSFDIGREHCIGKCVYCKEEDAVKRVNVELTRMRTETALGAIPSRFRVKSLNEFETSDQEARKEALEACWAVHHGELSNLILLGCTGAGKTHLLTSTVMEALRNGKSARYIIEDDLFKELKKPRGLYASDCDVVTSYSSYDLLAIDNIGRGKHTEYRDTDLFSIIDKRYDAMRQTMLASSLTVQELSLYYDDALLRRLTEDGRIIELKNKYAG